MENKKFEVKGIYTTRFITNSDSIVTMTVIKRTAKTVTYISDGEIFTRKIKEDENGAEWITTERYSMAPIFRAERRIA